MNFEKELKGMAFEYRVLEQKDIIKSFGIINKKTKLELLNKLIIDFQKNPIFDIVRWLESQK